MRTPLSGAGDLAAL
ncbi:hypothetical protein PIIN_11319 [Serendipita indica DSM 11827]|uniref:Uncharacterized protein n=1 Tax=Serendipita indica (strain DSM 11827) TaxID=1109443 RepID=G4U199_SERID|nr:hypothetical protein PIIN_11319 [Serendipita indica DSM 11827]